MRRNLCFTCKGKRDKHAEGAWKCDQLNREKGSRDSVPCGVWGNAPTVPRATSMPNALNKGAGSEASLPVTLRSRRRAPQAARPTTCTLSRQMGATDQHREQFVSCGWSFLLQGKAHCHKKSTPADARVDKFDNLWIILLPAGRHRHHRRGLLPAGQGRPRPHPEARRGLLRAQSASRACPQKSPDE